MYALNFHSINYLDIYDSSQIFLNLNDYILRTTLTQLLTETKMRILDIVYYGL